MPQAGVGYCALVLPAYYEAYWQGKGGSVEGLLFYEKRFLIRAMSVWLREGMMGLGTDPSSLVYLSGTYHFLSDLKLFISHSMYQSLFLTPPAPFLFLCLSPVCAFYPYPCLWHGNKDSN